MKSDNKIMEIIKVSGFLITSDEDPSVGIFKVEWVLKNDFYFDNKEELEEFRKDLEKTFEKYCGIVKVETFEERQKLIDSESY